MSTPLDLMRDYRQMSVVLDPGTDGKLVPAVQVDVHQYVINRQTKTTALNDRRAQTAATYDKVVARVRKEVDARKAAAKAAKGAGPAPAAVNRDSFLDELLTGLNNDLFNDVKYGKASPETIAVYLRLAVRYGFATAGTLQTFADDNLGLDCSGFVSNFWVRAGLLTKAQADSRNARSYNNAGKRRATLDAVRTLDLLVWEDGTHIGIIDGAPKPVLDEDPAAMKKIAQKAKREAAKAEQEARRARRRGAVPPPARVMPPPHVAGPAAVGAPASAAPVLPVGAPGYVPPPGMRVEYQCTVVESNGGRGLDSETYTLQSVNSRGVFDALRANGKSQKVFIINWDGGD